ncbi:MAG: hypothetical protein QM762_12810 [Chryseolinea sp.]
MILDPILWTGFLIGLSAGVFLMIVLLHRHNAYTQYLKETSRKNLDALELSMRETERAAQHLADTKEALSETFHDIYHTDIFPEICRSQGIFIVVETFVDEALIREPNNEKLLEAKKWCVSGYNEMAKLKQHFQSIIEKRQHFLN